jgi:hypothetical protein
VDLSTLYHWSPAARYDGIVRDGLRPGCPPTVAGGPLTYLCLSPSPSAAWAISGAMDYVNEISNWDLWQVSLIDGDELYVRPEFGPYIHEVKLRGSVPPDRLWWVGRRYEMGVPAETVPG